MLCPLEKSDIPTGHHFGSDKFLQELKAASDSPFGIVSSDITQFQSWIKQLETKEKKDYFRKILDKKNKEVSCKRDQRVSR